MARYEEAMFPRSKEIAVQGAEFTELIAGSDDTNTVQRLIDAFTEFTEQD
ncbi:hypothetical protein [Amycolatopsis sp. NPDC051061]